jgi:hypothetical protein
MITQRISLSTSVLCPLMTFELYAHKILRGQRGPLDAIWHTNYALLRLSLLRVHVHPICIRLHSLHLEQHQKQSSANKEAAPSIEDHSCSTVFFFLLYSLSEKKVCSARTQATQERCAHARTLHTHTAAGQTSAKHSRGKKKQELNSDAPLLDRYHD